MPDDVELDQEVFDKFLKVTKEFRSLWLGRLQSVNYKAKV